MSLFGWLLIGCQGSPDANNSILSQQLTVSGDSFVEGSQGNITLSVATPSPVDLTIQWSLVGDSAVVGQDFVGASGTAKIPAGSASATFAVVSINDSLYERDETFKVQMTTSDTSLNLPTEATLITIVDDDVAPVITVSDEVVVEGGSATVTVDIDVVSSVDVSVDYSLVDATATSPGDFSPATGTAIIVAGTTSTTISVLTNEDTIDEPDQIINVDLSSPLDATIADGTGEVTITDNDLSPTVAFVLSSSSSGEGTANANLEVGLSHESEFTVTVDYAVNGGTATGSGTDYTLSSGTLTFNPNVTSQNVVVNAVDDNIDEADETIDVQISNPSANLSLGAGVTHTLTLTDNDPLPVVTFALASSSVLEAVAGATHDIEVVLDRPSSSSITVDFGVTGGTATGLGTDYTLVNGTVTFLAGEVSKMVTVSILDETIDESDETIIVDLSNNSANSSLGGVASHTITITDDDSFPEINYALVSSNVLENVSGGTFDVEVTLSNPGAGSISVDYSVTGGTATGSGTDYTLSGGTLIFTPGQVSKLITVTLVDELLDEGDETILLDVSNNTGDSVLGSQLAHTLTIKDDEASGPFTISGADGGADVTVDEWLSSGFEVTAHWADALGETSYDVTIYENDGSTVKCTSVNVPADSTSHSFSGCTLTEGTNYKISVISRDGDSNSTVATNNLLVFTVDTLAPDAFNITGLSGGSDVAVDANLSEGEFTPTLNWQNTGGETDYDVSIFEDDGTTVKCVQANLAADVTSHTFTGCVLTQGVSYKAKVIANDATHNTVATNDLFRFLVSPDLTVDDITVAENVGGGNGVFTVSVNVVADQDVTFNWATSDGTALKTGPNEDYTESSGSGTITAGTTSTTINIPINDELIDEPDQYLNVTLSSIANGYSTDLVGVATITDDDVPSVVSVADVTGTESGNITFTLSLDRYSEKSIDVDWATVNGSGLDGTDFTGGTGTINIPVNTPSKTFDIATIDNAIVCQTDRTFNFNLSNPSNVTAGDMSAVGTIEEDDLVVVAASEASAVEGAPLTFELSLSQACSVDVTVDWQTYPNTAVEGQEFVHQTGTVTIPAALNSVSVQVNTLDDSYAETEESLFLVLSETGSGLTDNTSIGVGRIQDNDVSSSVSKIDGGISHTCALLSNGKVKCFGWHNNNVLGQPYKSSGDQAGEMGDDLPTLNLGSGRTAVQISVGDRNACSVLDDGNLKCWGENYQGRNGNHANFGYTSSQVGDNVPNVALGAGLTVTKVSARTDHTCALLNDGSVKCWGLGTSGRLGYGDTLSRTTAVQMGGNLPKVDLGVGKTTTDIKVGSAYTCALLNDFTLKCWGLGNSGRLGQGNVSSIGDNSGEMGDNLSAINFGVGRTVKAFSLGDSFGCAILDNDLVKCWGYGGDGRLGQENSITRGDDSGEMGDNLAYSSLGTGRTAKKITSGADHTCVILDNDKVKCWGNGATGQTGYGTTAAIGNESSEMGDNLAYVDVGTGRTAKEITAGRSYSCALLDNDTVKCWGENNRGQLGLEDIVLRGGGPGEMGDSLPVLNFGAGKTPLKLSGGAGHSTCVVFTDNTTKCWGYNQYGQLGDGDVYTGDEPTDMGAALPVVDLGTGVRAIDLDSAKDHNCVVVTDGSVKCWGYGTEGRLGLGDSNSRGDLGTMGDNLPSVNLGAGRTALRVSTGDQHTCALLDNFTMKCWGQGVSGQLGRGSTGDVNNPSLISPVDLGTGFHPIMVLAGDSTSCAISSKFDLKCWGAGSKGRLGLGDAISRGDGPGEMGDNLPVVSMGVGRKTMFVSGGSESTCAINDLGQGRCFGEGTGGRLGIGSTTDRGLLPGDVGNYYLTQDPGQKLRQTANAKGASSSCALTTDGIVKCFGSNTSGQLGVGTTSAKGDNPSELFNVIPSVDLGTGRTALSIGMGAASNCAVLDNHEAKCWGKSYYGETGAGHNNNIGDLFGEMGDNLAYLDFYSGSSGSPGNFIISGVTGGSDVTADAWLSNLTPTVEWTTSAAAVNYYVTVFESDGTTIKCAQQSTASTSYTFGGCTLSEGLSYKVKVTAEDGSSDQADASNSLFSFTVDTVAPSAFSVTGITGGQDVAVDTNLGDGASPRINWNLSPEGTKYEVTIFENDGTTVKCAVQSILGAVTSFSPVTCSLTEGVSYKAKVVTFDGANNSTEASNSLFAFTVNDVSGPAPFNITGVTGSSDVTVDNQLSSGTWPVVHWDDTDGENSYDVTVYENDGVTIKCATVNKGADVTSHSFESCNLAIATNYKIKVEAKDAVATTAATNSLFDFSVSSVGPDSFMITGIRGSGDTLVDNELSDGHRPEVVWNVAANAANYDVTIYEQDGTTVACATQNTTNLTFMFGVSCYLLGGKAYMADVVAKDGSSNPTPSFNSKYQFTLPSHPLITTGDPTTVEGSELSFPVSLSQTFPFDITVNYETNSNSAVKGDDYVHQEGSLTISAGQSTANIKIVTIDDSLAEREETLFLVLSNPVNGVVGGESLAYGSIQDNESGLEVYKISGGDAFSCALTSEGKVKCWGKKIDGMIGLLAPAIGEESGDMGDNLPGIDFGTGRSASMVISGAASNCVLLDNGKVKCWGDDIDAVLGHPSGGDRGDMPGEMGDNLLYTEFGESDTVSKIYPGFYSHCAEFTDNRLKCWGRNDYGALGQGHTVDKGSGLRDMGENLLPTPLPTGRTLTKLAGGSQFFCGLFDDAKVRCWGAGVDGRLGRGNTQSVGDSPGEMGDNLVAVDFGVGRTAKDLAVGGAYACAILDNDLVKCWGDNYFGQLGLGLSNSVNIGDSPAELGDNMAYIDLGTGRTAKSIEAGNHFTCVVLDNDQLKCWGRNTYGQLGYGDTSSRGLMGDGIPYVDLGTGRTVAQLSTFQNHVCVILDNGVARCWGQNVNGQLGVGHNQHIGDNPDEMGDQMVGIDVGVGRSIVSFANSAASLHTCATLDNGDVKCWGLDNYGQSGQGQMAIGDAPGEMGDNLPYVDLGDHRFNDLVSTVNHSCAVSDQGQLYCWGRVVSGSLGNGASGHIGDEPGELGNNLISSPMGSGLKVLKLAMGDDSACALLSDFSVKCFGENGSGQLGVGHINDKGSSLLHMGDNLVKVDLGTGRSAIDVSVGATHSCALLDNFKVKCWGPNSNNVGRIGTGVVVTYGNDPNEMGDNLPVIDLGTGYKAIRLTSMRDSNCVIMSDNQVKCWGNGNSGELLNGSTLDRGDQLGEMGDLLPYANFGSDFTIADFAQGGRNSNHMCARSISNKIKCWGTNGVGQLGLGHINNRGGSVSNIGDALPYVDLGDNLDVYQVFQGDSHSCAMLTDQKIKCWGYNHFGQLGLGSLGHIGDGYNEMGEALPYVNILGAGGGTPGAFKILGVAGGTDVTDDSWLGNSEATVSWETATGAVNYKATIFEEDGVTIKCNEATTAATSYSFTGCTLTEGGVYRVKVLAVDGSSNERTAQNALYTFVVDETAPGAFTIAGVVGGSDNTIDVQLDDGVYAIPSWTSSAGAVSYDVTIYENDGSTVKCTTVAKSAQSLYHSFAACELTDSLTYKVKVTAKDPTGNSTEATNSLFNFSVNDISAPSAFSISGVTGGLDFTEDASLTSGTWATIHWIDSEGEDSYDVTIYENDGTTIKCPTQNAPAGALSYQFGTCELTTGITYKAKVVAKDSVATTEASNSLYSFNVTSSGVTSFNITGVTGGTDVTSDSWLMDGNYPTVSWGASTGAVSYDVTIYEEDGITIKCPTKSAAGTSVTFGTCLLDSNTNYKISALAINGGDNILASNNMFVFSMPILPLVSTDRPSVTEGGLLTFTLSIPAVYPEDVTVKWTTVDLQATSSQDYTYATGLATITSGTTTTTFSVTTIDDLQDERDEYVVVRLYEAQSGYLVSSSMGLGTILDNDIGPHVVKGSTGTDHSCFLISDGSVKCVGDSDFGQLGNGGDDLGDELSEMGNNLSIVDLGTGRTAVKVATGPEFTCAILDNGKVKCWGNNVNQVLGQETGFSHGEKAGEMGDNLPYTELGTGRTAVQIAVGTDHACALLDDGGVKCWGDGANGARGSGNTLDKGNFSNHMGDDLPYVDLGTGRTALEIDLGREHSCARLDDLTMKCWGYGGGGRLGTGNTSHVGDGAGEMGDNLAAIDLGTGRTVTKIAVGGIFSCALLDDGTVKCFGDNGYSALGAGVGTSTDLGDGPGEMGDNLFAVNVGTGQTVVELAASNDTVCVITNTNQTKCWGKNNYGQLGREDTTQIGHLSSGMGDNLESINFGTGLTATKISSGSHSFCALLNNGSVKCWGQGVAGALGIGENDHRGDHILEMGNSLPAVDLGAGFTVASLSEGPSETRCAISTTGQLKCWGRNQYGQTGQNNEIGDEISDMGASLATVDLGSGVTVRDLSVGRDFNCALTDVGDVKCWGDGGNGKLAKIVVGDLGDEPGEMGDSLAYSELGYNKKAIGIYTGLSFGCALMDDFKVKCWGDNSSGRTAAGTDVGDTGTGVTTLGDNMAYLDFGADNFPVKISTGYSHSCVLLNSGQIKCWGTNNRGQLGYEDTIQRGDDSGEMGNNLPQVDLGSGRWVKDVNAYYEATCAQLDNDSLKCWGYGSVGRTGQGNTSTLGDGAGEMGDSLPIVQLGTGRTVKQLAESGHSVSMCVILDNDDVVCWGANGEGQLGIGNVSNIGDGATEMGDNLSPVSLGVGRTPIGLQLGVSGPCLTLDNFEIKCWGRNVTGLLGQGDLNNRGDGPGEMGDNLAPIDLGL